MAPQRFLQLIYRMPSKPTAGRVAVWRSLKKAGAVYLQDSACVLPDTEELRTELASVLARIDESDGSYHMLPLGELPAEEEAKLVQLFVDQTAKHYTEIVENCEVNFVKEIEFENFRENYTYEEAEEIREDLEKIRRWFDRVVERDWFNAGQRKAVAAELQECERLLEAFEEEVYRRAGEDEAAFPAQAAKAAHAAKAAPQAGTKA